MPLAAGCPSPPKHATARRRASFSRLPWSGRPLAFSVTDFRRPTGSGGARRHLQVGGYWAREPTSRIFARCRPCGPCAELQSPALNRRSGRQSAGVKSERPTVRGAHRCSVPFVTPLNALHRPVPLDAGCPLLPGAPRYPTTLEAGGGLQSAEGLSSASWPSDTEGPATCASEFRPELAQLTASGALRHWGSDPSRVLVSAATESP